MVRRGLCSPLSLLFAISMIAFTLWLLWFFLTQSSALSILLNWFPFVLFKLSFWLNFGVVCFFYNVLMDSSAFLLDLGLRKLEQRFYDLRQINIILHFIAVTQSTLQATKRQRTWDKEAMTNKWACICSLLFTRGKCRPHGSTPMAQEDLLSSVVFSLLWG